MNELSKFEKVTTILQVIATFALALTGIIGLIFVLIQLNQFKIQNRTLARSLSQTYRPLGVARYSWEKEGVIILSYPSLENKDKDKFSFGATLI